MKWMHALEENQEAQSTNVVQEDIPTNEQESNIEVHIFCNHAVNKEGNQLGIRCRLGIRCIAYTRR